MVTRGPGLTGADDRHAIAHESRRAGRRLRQVADGSVHGTGLPSLSALADVFATSPVGTAVLDPNGVVLCVNPALEGLLRQDAAAVTGGPFALQIAVEDRDDVLAKLAQVVMRTAPGMVLRGVRLAAELPGENAVDLYASPVEADGEVGALLVQALDATERRDLELRVRHAHKLQALGQLSGGIAHDFNNLIAAMLGFCELLLGRHQPADPDYADLAEIRTNALRARDLVRQLLAFARKQPLRPARLAVGPAIESLLPMLRGQLGPAIAVETAFDKALPPVWIDPAQFDQVIVNLVINARDAMPRGGRLSLRATALAIDEQTTCRGEDVFPGDYVRICVSDTGCGISREIIDGIFEPFFTTKADHGGTGLGLATVWGIVRQSGGHINVDSAPGAGSTFCVCLPAATAAEHSTQPAADAPAILPSADVVQRSALVAGPSVQPAAARTTTVLLVDDEAAIRSFAARALRARGYAVIEAEDGDAALRALAERPSLDVLVTDWALPDGDARLLIEDALQRFPAVQVVVISAHLERFVATSSDGEPRVWLLPKPFTLAELAAAVKRASGG